jgi:hypothetical protein
MPSLGDIARPRVESNTIDLRQRPAEWIVSFAEDLLKAFSGTIALDGSYRSRIYQSTRSVSEHIAADYGSRFLLELIQNAYDALADGPGQGRIRIVWNREEGEHGTLYIANDGRPFERRNVRALCEVGLSDKPPGHSIGNKGLGFRSVSYVTDDPQIFSALDPANRGPYAGHCFRFATRADLKILLPDPVHLEKALTDLPRFHVPMPAGPQNEEVCAAAADGFVTCIRLPLRDATAASALASEIETFRTATAPVHLFLPRLKALEFRVESSAGSSFVLSRSHRPLELPGFAVRDEAAVVDLGSEGSYFVVSASVPESEVKEAIERSVVANQVHSSWHAWEGPGELALAFRLDGALQPRLYTHLPMAATAGAPLPGHLHASFFAKADRRAIEPEIHVNRLYLDRAVDLVARTLVALDQLLSSGGTLPDPRLRTVLPDLVTWSDIAGSKAPIALFERLRSSVAALGGDLLALNVLPALEAGNGPAWSSISRVWAWSRPAESLFAPQRLTKSADVPILDDGIGEERMGRVRATFGRLRVPLDPPRSIVAEWAEALARDLNRRRSRVSLWRRFYQELAELFASDGSDLLGREVLHCSDGTLRATSAPARELPTADAAPTSAGRRPRQRLEISVFLPARAYGAAGAAVQVPPDLSRGLAFLDQRLGWYDDEMQAARSFLERAKLVRDYDADELIAHVSRVLQQRNSRRAFAQALGWVHGLFKAGKKSQRPLSLRRARLRVPTANGDWIPAERACFGEGWPDHTLGPLLQRFLRQTSDSPGLKDFSKHVLSPPDEAPFRGEDRDSWTEFLVALGVLRGLQAVPLPKRLPPFLLGSQIDAGTLGDRLSLSGATQASWAAAAAQSFRPVGYSSSFHELDGTLWVLPGQDEHHGWPNETRLLYAELALHWLPNAREEHWRVHFFSQAARHKSRFEWPTPLAAFVRKATWLPTRDNYPGSDIRFVEPAGVWLDGTGDEDRPPAFLPSLHRRAAKLLDALPGAQAALQRDTDVRRWNSPETLSHQLDYLARLFAQGRIDTADQIALLRNYRDTWRRLALSGRTLAWTTSEEHLLLLEVSGSATVRPIEPGPMPAPGPEPPSLTDGTWVRDEAHCLALDLMNALGVPVFDVDREVAPRIAELLAPVLGASLRRLSEVTTEVIVDGTPLHEFSSGSESVRAVCAPIDVVVLVAAAAMSGVAAQSLPADHRQLTSRLGKLRVLSARRITFRMEGVEVDLPENRHGVLLLWQDGIPHVLVESEGPVFSWGDLRRASGALAEVLRQLPMEHALRAAFRVFERLGVPIGTAAPGSDVMEALAAELGLGIHAVTGAVASHGLAIPKVMQMLRPVAHYWAGTAAVEQLDQDGPGIGSTEALVSWVQMHLEPGPALAGEVVEACRRARSFAELRDDLRLDFKRFNRSLAAVGEAPEWYPEVHRRVFESYCADQFHTISNRLRAPFADAFTAFASLRAYLDLLEQWKALEPPAEWLKEFAEPPPEAARDWANAWLNAHACPEVGPPYSPEPVDELRRTNKKTIERFASRSAALVRVWTVAHDAVLHPLWTQGEAGGERIAEHLYRAGVLDFEVLTEAQIIGWLRATGVWPAEMPLSTDLSVLGLPAQEIRSEEDRRREERERRARERRMVDFGGVELDPDDLDINDVASRLITRTAELAATRRFGREIEMAMPRTGPRRLWGSGGPGGDGGRGRERIHPRKAELIGLIGEIAVYQWLKTQFPRRNIDEAWVSENRSHLLPGEGNDGLGYDFELKFRDRTQLIEVKTHTGDPLEIQLGESQVRAASECARRKGREFVILYVSHADDPTRLRIEQLPNPVSGIGARQFELQGEGLRYRFWRR